MTTTLESIKAQTEELYNMRQEKKEIERELSMMNASIEALSMNIISELEAAELKSFKGSNCTVSVVEEQKVKVPATIEARKALADYFKKTGRNPLEYFSVHSGTLNSFYKAESEIQEEGFILPGCEMGELRRKLSVTSK